MAQDDETPANWADAVSNGSSNRDPRDPINRAITGRAALMNSQAHR
jgi:hypothetical protein